MNSFFNTIILLGSLQGFILFFLLRYSKQNKRANRILAWLIFLIAYASFNLFTSYTNFYGSELLRFIYNFIPMVLVMPMGPLIYFYVQSVLDPTFTITGKQKWHFLTVIIDLVPPLIVIIFVIGVLTHTIKNNAAPVGVFIDDYNVYADIPRWLSVTIYLWLSSKKIRAYNRNHTNRPMLSPSFRWLKQIIIAFLIFQSIWFVYLIPYVIPKYSNWVVDTFDWYPIYIPMAVLVYWLGIKGYIVSQQKNELGKKANPANPISQSLVATTIDSLKKVMEEDNIYLNPNLNLAIVSDKTGIATKTISAVINQHLQKSFNEYVNEYRVNEFKKKIALPEMNQLTIAGIASECGFNSLATFQRTFKEITGTSPSEFRKTLSPIRD